MSDSLDLLLTDGVIDEVIGRLKSGKEADVWLVRHRGEAVAAKIYKDRAVRSFKNNSGYTEGRKTRNTRTQRAMDRGSRFGKKAAEDAWKETEADALFKLHAAGVRVPTPHMYYEGVLLMELVLAPDGSPAPRLIETLITKEEAGIVYADMRTQIVRMLCSDIIHGDLSPYNVLLGEKGPVIIDFPQTIDAAANNRASFYFQRDMDNIFQHFLGIDRGLQARRSDGRVIWKTWEKRELTPDFEPSEAPQEPEPRPAEPSGSRLRGKGGPIPEIVHVGRLGDVAKPSALGSPGWEPRGQGRSDAPEARGRGRNASPRGPAVETRGQDRRAEAPTGPSIQLRGELPREQRGPGRGDGPREQRWGDAPREQRGQLRGDEPRGQRGQVRGDEPTGQRGQLRGDAPREQRGQARGDEPRGQRGQLRGDEPRGQRGPGRSDAPREPRGPGRNDTPREPRGPGRNDTPREPRGPGRSDAPREPRGPGRSDAQRGPSVQLRGELPREQHGQPTHAQTDDERPQARRRPRRARSARPR